MEWKLSAFSWNDPTSKREIRAASARKLVVRLNAPSTFACSMSGKHRQAKLITELVTDVMVRCDEEDVCRLRCGNAPQTVGDSGHGISYSFSDYRAVLARRRMKASDAFFHSSTEQSDIAWELITKAQARANGNYGITRGVGAVTGIDRQWDIKQGAFVGKEIESMSNMANGFDWDIGTDMAFNVYYPLRGENKGVGIEYGKTISSFTRTKTPSDFSNDDLVTGGAGTTPVEQESPTILTDLMGRWDGNFSYPSIVDQVSLSDRASWLVARTGLLSPIYNLRLIPDFWRGMSHIGIGDIIRVVVRTGNILDDLLLRVIQISIAIGDSGGEDIQLGLAGL